MSGDRREDRKSDGGYVHRPDDATDVATDEAVGSASEEAADGNPEGLGIYGWVLVGVVVLTTLVIPGLIYLFPAAPDSAGLSFYAAMIALPLVPAVLLGAVAVWSAVVTGPQFER